MGKRKPLPFRNKTFVGAKFQKQVEELLVEGITWEYQLKEASSTFNLDVNPIHHFISAWEYNRKNIVFLDSKVDLYYEPAIRFFSDDVLEVTFSDDKVMVIALDNGDLFPYGLLSDLIYKKHEQAFSGEKKKIKLKLISPLEKRNLLKYKQSQKIYEDKLSSLKESIIRNFKSQNITSHLFCERLKLFSLETDPETCGQKLALIEEKLENLPLSVNCLDVGELLLMEKLLKNKNYNAQLLEQVKLEFNNQLDKQLFFLNNLSNR